MAYRLKNRQMQIPGGLRFHQPQTKWRSAPYASFSVICNGLRQHRLAHPDLVAKHRWATELADIEEEVDAFNARLCVDLGHMQFVQGLEVPASAPFRRGPRPVAPPPVNVANAGNVAVRNEEPERPGWLKTIVRLKTGAYTLGHWLGEGGSPVPPEQANRRAAICANCPKNLLGELDSFFTRTASELIRKQLSERSELKLTTTADDRLGVCDACGCPLKLKVHVPLKTIMAHIAPEDKSALHPQCWMNTEP